MLFYKNPVQIPRLGQQVQYFRIAFDSLILLVAAWAARRWFVRLHGWRRGLPLAGLLLLWLIPVFWIPGNVIRGALPEKPRLIAHRGASTLAPENTLAAMQAAASLGVYGLETDIIVSADGVLYLMHDSTLARTTDVAGVFPGREEQPAQDFTWDELTRLDAGGWFGGQALFAGEPIPTLEQFLRVVGDHELYFIYDLRIPSAGHAYADRAFALCLEEIASAGVAGRTWVLADPEEIDIVETLLPGAILAAGIDFAAPPSPESLTAQGYGVVNSEFGLSERRIRAYREAGLWVNLWTVDEAWQYSRLWLAGADSVTSNYVQIFANMSRPVAAMPYWKYLMIWGAIGLLAGGGYQYAGRTQSGVGKAGQGVGRSS